VKALVLVMFAWSGASATCAANEEALSQEREPVAVAIEALAESPESYLDRSVRITGTLTNAGTNYFTDTRIVLVDDEEREIYVQPWLPLSVPPSPRGAGAEKDTLARYLDKTVELTGIWKEGRLEQVGRAHFLEVSAARILYAESSGRD